MERKAKKLDLSYELIKEAHSQSMEAHKQSQQHHYLTNKKKQSSSSSMGIAIFAFPGSWEVKDWFHDHLFGETDVDHHLFPSLRRVGENKPAKVNRGFLERFQKLLEKTHFESEVNKAVMEDKKKILLTGHSSGGAMACFATLWILEKFTRERKIEISIGCLTFGSPLIGDKILSHALRRDKWADLFTHFVMEYDIIPRIMLAPHSSIQEQLPHILTFFQEKVNPRKTSDQKSSKLSKLFDKVTLKQTSNKDHDHDQNQNQSKNNQQVLDFFENVLTNASAVASYVASDLMEPTSSLMDKLSVDFVKVSPYRPFGTYIFCTRSDDQTLPRLIVENPNAILELLFYFCQLTSEDQSLFDFALKSLNANLSYEEELNKNRFQLQNMVNLKDLNDHLLTPNGTPGDMVHTSNKGLYELSARSRLCLMAIEAAEKRKIENGMQVDALMKKLETGQKKVKKTEATKANQKNMEELLGEIRKYKEICSKGKMGYYDTFKIQNSYEDFTANVNRLELAKIWDVIIEMVIREDLPDEFEGRKEWVDLGTEFRHLVEPLDIANYYRHEKGEDTKMYLKVRPKRYKFLQRWYEHANVTPFMEISESNFLAEVEEIKKKEFDEVKERAISMANQVLKWVFDDKVLGEDVFLEESTLSKWWKGLPCDYNSLLKQKLSKP